MFIVPYSLGQIALDSLSARLGVRLSPDKSIGGYFAETEIDINDRPFKVAFYKTRTYFGVVFQYASNLARHNKDAPMNISGAPVLMALRKSSCAPSSVIVLHDSIEHKPTALSPKFGGTAEGHNGVRSLILSLGTRDFFRLRLGIGRPDSDVAAYVLARLPNFERQFWTPDGPGLDLVWEQIQRIALKIEKARP